MLYKFTQHCYTKPVRYPSWCSSKNDNKHHKSPSI